MSVVSACPGHASAYLARAAITAPSLHNTQPWHFVAHGDRGIELHAVAERGLPLADPLGREMVLGCGAALLNIRLAMLHLGFRPLVDTFPDPQDLAHLATVGWGAYTRPTPEEQRLYAALGRRHTARGPFLPQAPPSGLLEELREQVRREGAELHVVDDSADRRRLAELVRAGEDAHRTDARLAAEQAGWTWRLAQPRNDGVPADVGVLHPDCTTLAGRDYAGLTGMFPTPPRRWPARTGLVVLLGTDRDDLAAWLRAGQALERMLLQAASHDVMAAFHTQPLEVPHLRGRIRQTLTAGQYPQMILRLGRPPCVRSLPRRPLAEVLT
ncbi:Acg family FMN-binding oxidoreductase [Streptomyces sp. NPDC048737]|uniref:Acg family FMN-binding oxidoreductase n=1 Tax=unclassified Streptomyces TaxID=2593676 RepID=UPI0034234D31